MINLLLIILLLRCLFISNANTNNDGISECLCQDYFDAVILPYPSFSPQIELQRKINSTTEPPMP
eukprot:Pgem_evm1s12940